MHPLDSSVLIYDNTLPLPLGNTLPLLMWPKLGLTGCHLGGWFRASYWPLSCCRGIAGHVVPVKKTSDTRASTHDRVNPEASSPLELLSF